MSEETKVIEEQVEAPTVQETAETSTEETATVETPAEETVNPKEFLANFDWHKYEEGIEAVGPGSLPCGPHGGGTALG